MEKGILLTTGSEQNRGFQLVYGSTANLFIDRHDEYIGYGPEAMELVGLPTRTPLSLPGIKSGQGFCVCFRNREERENAGAFNVRLQAILKSPTVLRNSSALNSVGTG